jgi:hypothetical protein
LDHVLRAVESKSKGESWWELQYRKRGDEELINKTMKKKTMQPVTSLQIKIVGDVAKY